MQYTARAHPSYWSMFENGNVDLIQGFIIEDEGTFVADFMVNNVPIVDSSWHGILASKLDD